MKLLIDSFWRAAMYCLYPRVIGLSFLPLVLIVALSWLLGYLYWDIAVTGVRGWLDASSWLAVVWRWLEGIGLPDLKTVVAPLLVIFSVTPLVVVASLLAVSFLMTPALTRLVADRRFAGLQRKHGGSLALSLWWTFLSLLLALGALLLTLPMWLVPPLAMVLPALIWGWLTYRVMAFDVLAEFASADERHALMARHRMSFLGMGVVTGHPALDSRRSLQQEDRGLPQVRSRIQREVSWFRNRHPWSGGDQGRRWQEAVLCGLREGLKFFEVVALGISVSRGGQVSWGPVRGLRGASLCHIAPAQGPNSPAGKIEKAAFAAFSISGYGWFLRHIGCPCR
jgi:hypothetical protein